MAAASTVRFSDLVAKGGKPEVHLSWVAPAKDPDLQRALKQHRLVTLHQHARGPRDFGVVGFEPATDAQFLVFPKSLRAFAGRKVIGIKYELLQKNTPAKPAARKPEKPPPAQSPAPRASAPGRTHSSRRAATPAPEPAVESEADFITETDPVKRDVRKALIALSAGRTAEAKRRLQAILAEGAGD